MELTPANSPKYNMGDIKKQNALWRKRVREWARSLTVNQLEYQLVFSQEVLNETQSIAIAQTETARLKEMKVVYREKTGHDYIEQ